MSTYCYAVWDEFINFIGGKDGLIHWILFGVAICCCAFLGKGERKRLFWPSALVLLFFFNPIFYAVIGTRFLTGVYWRLLWMLPISFVIAYTVTQMAYKVKKDVFRLCVLAMACVCIVATGKPVLSAETYTEKENSYEISQAAIEICDIVMGDLSDWKENIIVPNELLCDIRQYSCSVGLLYGRNAGGFISDIEPDENAVYEEMCKQEPDVAVITDIAKQRGCRYIVFNTSFHRIHEDLSGYGYEKLTSVQEDYVVYRRIPE